MQEAELVGIRDWLEHASSSEIAKHSARGLTLLPIADHERRVRFLLESFYPNISVANCASISRGNMSQDTLLLEVITDLPAETARPMFRILARALAASRAGSPTAPGWIANPTDVDLESTITAVESVMSRDDYDRWSAVFDSTQTSGVSDEGMCWFERKTWSTVLEIPDSSDRYHALMTLMSVAMAGKHLRLAALSFDGSTQYVEVADANALDLTSSWTIEARVKPTNVDGVSQHVISKMGTGPDASYTMEINAGKLRSVVHDGVNPTQIVESSGTLSNNTWQHIAITLGQDTLRLYIDGGLDTVIAGSQKPNVSTRVLAFGRQSVGGLHYQGVLDEVRIWSVTRSGSEIAGAMNDLLTGSEAGLVGYWTFDEGAGDVAADATGNGHDGRLGSAVGADANDPQWSTDAAPIPTGCCLP